jgi:pimeloyl-ACP methyl ester carboxylesterase
MLFSMMESKVNRRDMVKSTAVAAVAGAVAIAAASPSIAAAPKRAAAVKSRYGSRIEMQDGASIFFNDWGKGRPVVFTHAWGLNADIWEYQLNELVDKGMRCVAYDRRGHGRSNDPGHGYDYDTLSDDLGALLEQLDLRDVTLVGFSMGNGEAVRYLARHGRSRIARLVMVSAMAPQADGGVFASFIAGLKQDRPAFFASGINLFTGGSPAVSSALSQRVLAQFLRTSPKAAIECMRANGSADFHADLKAVDVPTLIIHGSKDQINPIDRTARKTSELIRGSELKVYEDAPHGLVISHREQLTRDILSFVNS